MSSFEQELANGFRPDEMTDLRGRVVSEPVVLEAFDMPQVDLAGTVFEQPVSFKRAVFRGLSWFQKVEFRAGADFSQALFQSDARFDGARFLGPVSFSGAEFHGVPCFDRTAFANAAHFDHVLSFGNFSIGHARFEGAVTFQDSEFFGGFWCDHAAFGSRIDMRGLEVHGRTWLAGSSGESRQAERAFSELRPYGYVRK